MIVICDADEESPTYGGEDRNDSVGAISGPDRGLASMHAALQAQLASQLAHQNAVLAAAVAAAAQHQHQNNNVIGKSLLLYFSLIQYGVLQLIYVCRLLLG